MKQSLFGEGRKDHQSCLKIGLFIAVPVIFLTFLLSYLGGVQILELKILDRFINAHDEPPAARMIIIDMGKDPANVCQRLEEVVSCLRDKKARAIGIDMLIFQEKEKLSHFAGLSGPLKNVVFSTRPGGELSPQEYKAGFVGLFPVDPDRIVRRTKLVLQSQGREPLSFALSLCCVYENIPLSEVQVSADNIRAGSSLSIPLERYDSIIINYNKREIVQEIPAAEIKEMERDAFKQAIVLVGNLNDERDRFSTPIGNEIPGLYIQAQIINTILGRHFVKKPSAVVFLFILALLALLSAGSLLYWKRLEPGIILPLVLLPAYLLASSLVFKLNNLYLPVFTPSLAIVLSALAALVVRRSYRMHLSGSHLPGLDEDTLVDKKDQERCEKVISSSFSSITGVLEIKKGTVLGKYKILEKLGAGGMGEVFLVEHLSLKVTRVIKMILPDLLPNPRIREKFCIEAEAAARLNDPRIVTIHDFGEVCGIPYIEMEYFESENLRQELAGGPLTPTRVYTLMEKITAGLKCAHSAKPSPMIHSDLKPENILISKVKPSQVKIIDFGLVKLLQEERSQEQSSTGTMGSPYYMAPEQFEYENLGAGTDIYSLGVVLFEMVTSRRPFDDGNVFEIMDAHINAPVPSAYGLNSSFPKEIDDVIKKAMEKKIEKRFASVEEFFSHLAEVLSQTDERR